VKNANDIQEAVNTVKRLLPPSAGIFSDFVSSSCVNMSIFYRLKRLLSDCVNTHVDSSVITRHSLVRVKGEVFVLLFVFFVCSLFLSTISRQPAGRFTPKFACGRILDPDVSSPLLGVSGPRGRKKGK